MAYVTDTDLAATGVGQGANMVGFVQGGTDAVPRMAMEKLRETVSITDYGAVSGLDIVAAVNAALTALGTSSPATLIFPRGVWLIGSNVDWSPWRHITFRIDPGASINHGALNVLLPERVEIGLGASFTGTGARLVLNKDRIPLVGPGAPGDGYIQAGNHAMGLDALKSVGSGTNNFAWGFRALSNVTYASDNIAIGTEAGKSITGLPGNTHAYGTTLRQGDGNTLIGTTAGRDITTGYENTFIGAYSGQKQQTGRWNIGLGPDNLILNTSGECNVAIGPYALVTFGGNNSTAIGFATLENHLTGGNVAIGHVAMNGSVDSERNVALGAQAGEKWANAVDCVGIGQEVARNMTKPSQSVFIGAYAAGSSPATAEPVFNTTAVGYMSLLNNRGTGNTAIGTGCLNTLTTEVNCFGIGVGAAVTGSNQGQLGNPNVTVYAYGAVQDRSDGRDKADVRDTILGLDFLKALRPVDFRWDRRDEYRTEPPAPFKMERPSIPAPRIGSPTYEADLSAYQAAMAPYEDSLAKHRAEMDAWAVANKLGNITPDGSNKRVRFHHGLIAQEVKAVLDKLGIDFGGYQHHAINGGDDVLSIGYTELIGPIIKAVQELAVKIDALESAS